MSDPVLLHTNICASELRGGGKNSVGTERVLFSEHAHYAPEEMAARFAELVQQGYHLTISVLAYKDKRKPVVSQREQFRVPRCDCHNCPEYAAAVDRLVTTEATP